MIRVTVQLIDGHTGTTKWSQRYDLKSADILTFEDEMATKVVEGLQIQISPTEQKAIQQPVTTNVDAYNDYLQARFYLNEYFVYSGVDSLEKGERLLLHAVSLDQDFADAYALLAQMYSLQSANFFVEAGANVKRGEEAAKNALRINPQSVEGMVALGGIYSEEGREQGGDSYHATGGGSGSKQRECLANVGIFVLLRRSERTRGTGVTGGSFTTQSDTSAASLDACLECFYTEGKPTKRKRKCGMW